MGVIAPENAQRPSAICGFNYTTDESPPFDPRPTGIECQRSESSACGAFAAEQLYAIGQRQSLLKAVWGVAHRNDLDYLRVAVRALRRKIEKDPANPKLIINEPGVGYRLAVA